MGLMFFSSVVKTCISSCFTLQRCAFTEVTSHLRIYTKMCVESRLLDAVSFLLPSDTLLYFTMKGPLYLQRCTSCSLPLHPIPYVTLENRTVFDHSLPLWGVRIALHCWVQKGFLSFLFFSLYPLPFSTLWPCSLWYSTNPVFTMIELWGMSVAGCCTTRYSFWLS